MTNSVAAPPRRRARRGLEIALVLLVVLIAAVLVIGTMRVPRAQQERAAVRRLWRLGTVVLFEGDTTGYTNPPLTPSEWDVELRRSWVDDLFAASPTRVLFVRFSRSVGWPEPIVEDDNIPELIDILRQLPTVTQVTLDQNITPAGKARLKNSLPTVHFVMPPRIP